MHKKKSNEESKRQLFSMSVSLEEDATLLVTEMVTGDIRVAAVTITEDKTVHQNEMYLCPETFAKLNEVGLRWLVFVKERERKELEDGGNRRDRRSGDAEVDSRSAKKDSGDV
jgi:hypothetical protein